MKLRKILLPLLVLVGSILFLTSPSEAVLIFDGSATFGSGANDVTIQVKVWGPTYTGAEVAAGTIPNAASATTLSTFYTYAYRLTNPAGNNAITSFRVSIAGSGGASFGTTTVDSGSGTAPTAQDFATVSGVLSFRNTFGLNIAAGGTSQWMWLTSPLEPSLPSGYVLGDSVGGRFSRTVFTDGELSFSTDGNLPAPNPEPATSLLFSTGLGGLAFWRRRQVGAWLKDRFRRQSSSPSPEGSDPT